MISRTSGERKSPLRVAIVGAGIMGYWHGRTAHRLGARVMGVADINPQRAKALAHALQADVAADAATLLQVGQVDAVHICTPLASHSTLAEQAIEAGIHALVEKPLANTAEETRRLTDHAARNAVVLCPVHQIAFQNGIHAAQALCGIGDARAVDFRICSAGGVGRSNPELDEIVGEILPHPLSVLRRLWPQAPWEPQSWFVSHSRPGELLVSGEHAGALLSVLISMHARPTCFEMTVRGQSSAIHLDFFHGFAVRHDGRVSRLRKILHPFVAASKLFGTASINLFARGIHGEAAYPGLQRLMQDFYGAARGECPSPIPAEDVVAVAAARDTILARVRRLIRESDPSTVSAEISGT